MRIVSLVVCRYDDPLLPIWIAYHGHLLGFENLIVVDRSPSHSANGLHRFEAAGVTVVRSFAEDAGRIAGEIDRLRGDGLGGLLIPLEADEFIAAIADEGPTVRRAAIAAALAALGGEEACIETALETVFGRLDHFRLMRHRRAVISLETGMNIPAVKDGPKPALIRLFARPRGDMGAAAQAKLAGWPQTPDPIAITFDPERHRLGVFADQADADYQGHDEPYYQPHIGWAGFRTLLTALSSGDAFADAWAATGSTPDLAPYDLVSLDDPPFSATAYLDQNPDVRGLADPFEHYVGSGYREGRCLKPGREGWDEAIRRLGAFRAGSPDLPVGYQGLAMLHTMAGSLEDAERAIGPALLRFPDDQTILQQAARIALNLHNYDDAIKRASAAYAVVPTVDNLQVLVLGLLGDGKADDADGLLDKALFADRTIRACDGFMRKRPLSRTPSIARSSVSRPS